MISHTFSTLRDVKKLQKVLLCTTEGTTTTNLWSPHSLDNTSFPTAILLKDTSKCTCLQRELTPPKPPALSFPATDANCQELEDWLKSCYAWSAFNICSHQLLPIMDTQPLCLMIDLNTTVVIHHAPVQVPVHWQEEFKAILDHGVKFGRIEPVPEGEPITWCYRMLISAKKDYSPWQKVGF